MRQNLPAMPLFFFHRNRNRLTKAKNRAQVERRWRNVQVQVGNRTGISIYSGDEKTVA